jgi:hypothetical protein
VLESELLWLQNGTEAMPVVLTHKEVQAILANLSRSNWLLVSPLDALAISKAHCLEGAWILPLAICHATRQAGRGA